MPGEQLRATIYEFRPDNGSFISLTRMSLRQSRSVTTNTSQPQAAAFRATLLARHPTCVISHHAIQRMLIASHLMPRRLGDAAIRSSVERFTGSPNIVQRYDPLLGVPLVSTLDTLVDGYELGFWNCGPVSHLTFSTPSC
jgi:hypothetical protein